MGSSSGRQRGLELSPPQPLWLPEPLSFRNDCGGNWHRYLDSAYPLFAAQFIYSKPTFRDKPVVHDTKQEQGKDNGFWHVIEQEDYELEDRYPHQMRMERITWVRPIIENFSDPLVSVWENDRHNQRNHILWLESFDYKVVLTEFVRVVVLRTAYCTFMQRKRDQERKERAAFYKTQQPPP